MNMEVAEHAGGTCESYTTFQLDDALDTNAFAMQDIAQEQNVSVCVQPSTHTRQLSFHEAVEQQRWAASLSNAAQSALDSGVLTVVRNVSSSTGPIPNPVDSITLHPQDTVATESISGSAVHPTTAKDFADSIPDNSRSSGYCSGAENSEHEFSLTVASTSDDQKPAHISAVEHVTVVPAGRSDLSTTAASPSDAGPGNMQPGHSLAANHPAAILLTDVEPTEVLVSDAADLVVAQHRAIRRSSSDGAIEAAAAEACFVMMGSQHGTLGGFCFGIDMEAAAAAACTEVMKSQHGRVGRLSCEDVDMGAAAAEACFDVMGYRPMNYVLSVLEEHLQPSAALSPTDQPTSPACSFHTQDNAVTLPATKSSETMATATIEMMRSDISAGCSLSYHEQHWLVASEQASDHGASSSVRQPMPTTIAGHDVHQAAQTSSTSSGYHFDISLLSAGMVQPLAPVIIAPLLHVGFSPPPVPYPLKCQEWAPQETACVPSMRHTRSSVSDPGHHLQLPDTPTPTSQPPRMRSTGDYQTPGPAVECDWAVSSPHQSDDNSWQQGNCSVAVTDTPAWQQTTCMDEPSATDYLSPVPSISGDLERHRRGVVNPAEHQQAMAVAAASIQQYDAGNFMSRARHAEQATPQRPLSTVPGCNAYTPTQYQQQYSVWQGGWQQHAQSHMQSRTLPTSATDTWEGVNSQQYPAQPSCSSHHTALEQQYSLLNQHVLQDLNDLTRHGDASHTSDSEATSYDQQALDQLMDRTEELILQLATKVGQVGAVTTGECAVSADTELAAVTEDCQVVPAVIKGKVFSPHRRHGGSFADQVSWQGSSRRYAGSHTQPSKGMCFKNHQYDSCTGQQITQPCCCQCSSSSTIACSPLLQHGYTRLLKECARFEKAVKSLA